MSLLERQHQLDELERHLRGAANVAGRIAFVSGEAGAGKSTLVEQFGRQAARTARIFWGHSDALQTSRVLGPVNELLTAASPSAAPRESNLSREQLFARLLERFSPPQPLSLVILEDLHWADEATLDFVRFLGRRIQRTRCLLVATYRDDELTPTHLLRGVLGELTGQHTARIRVPPLSFHAVEQLARGTRRDAQKVYDVTGGNPFFVRELLSAPIDTVPESVRDAVLARVLQCSENARKVAELVSLLPGKAEWRLVEAILGNIYTAADEAVARGLLRYHDDETLSFRHELGRLAVESTVPRALAQSLHQKILRCLIAADADLSRLVHHALHAQDVSRILEYAPRAATEAARAGAHREAIAHLRTALRHLDSLSKPDAAYLCEFLATECNVTNEVTAALESANRALDLWQALGDVAARARMLVLISRQHWKAGQTALAEQRVASAIALLEALPPSRDLATAYSARAQLAMTSDRTEETLDYAQRALDLAIRFDDHATRAHALNNIGTALLNAGNHAGLAKLEESLAVALEHRLHYHGGRAYANLVSSAVRQNLPGLAERYVADGIEYCEVHEVQDSLAYLRAFGSHFDLRRGEWDRAAGMAAELVEHHKLANAQRIPALTVLALVRARRGDPGVDSLLDEAMELALPTGELQRIGRVAATRAEVAWYRGDLQRMAQEVAIGLKAASGHRDPWIPGELAYWGRVANPVLEIPDSLAEPYALMIAGDWRAAATAWHALGAPYERALALTHGPEEALREALTILEPMGAGPLAAIVRQRLRDLGARKIPRGPRASTRENPAGLTSREVQVLALLVHGHTNSELALRLHLSAKTVDHHVSSILQKLGVHSRTEAVTAAFGLGIVKTAQ